MVVVNGKEYTTLEELTQDFGNQRVVCEVLGINLNTFSGRKSKHPERGLDYWVTGKHENIAVTYENKNYKTYKELCEYLGVVYSTFCSRKITHPDKGIEYWLNCKFESKNIHYNGVYAKNYKELCEKLGVKYASFKYRRTHNKQASMEYLLYGVKNFAENVHYNGVYAKNYKELCEKLGVSYSSYKYRKKHNKQASLGYLLYGAKYESENVHNHVDLIRELLKLPDELISKYNLIQRAKNNTHIVRYYPVYRVSLLTKPRYKELLKAFEDGVKARYDEALSYKPDTSSTLEFYKSLSMNITLTDEEYAIYIQFLEDVMIPQLKEPLNDKYVKIWTYTGGVHYATYIDGKYMVKYANGDIREEPNVIVYWEYSN